MKNTLQVNTDYFENVVACQALTNSFYTSLVLDYLSPENFKLPGNKLVISIVKDFFSKRQAIPTVTELKTYIKNADELKVLKDTLTTYKGINLNGNIDELIHNSELFFKERLVYNTVERIVNNVIEEKPDYSKFLAWFERACNVNLVNNIGLDFYREYKKIIDDLTSNNETYPTGWKFIDEKIGGGLLKEGKALYLFLGPTNVGKSIFLGNIAANMAEQGLNTVLITLEMSEMMYAKRISSHLSKIPINEIHNQSTTLEKYFEETSVKHNNRLIIKEFPPKSVTVGGIKGFLETLVKSGIKPDVLVLDYLGLVKESGGENSYEQGKKTSEELRAMSYFFKIPVISAVQTNREGIEDPSLDTVSESFGVAFTADVVWGIYQEDGDQELGIIKVKCIKNRLGPKHNANAMRIDYRTLSLSEEQGYIGINNGKSKGSGLDEVSDLESKLDNITD